MSAHAPECEKADPGSLCDCDCAGARHAVRRTAGNVPGAGQVSKRAQQAAARDGRASVVNTRAVPGAGDAGDAGKHRKAGRHRPDVNPQPVPPPVKSSARPPRLSPTTKQHADTVRASLPSGADAWKAAAVQLPAGAERRWLLRTRRESLAEEKELQKPLDAMLEQVARDITLPRLLADKRPGFRMDPNDPQSLEYARNLAMHDLFADPDLSKKWYALQEPRVKAEDRAAAAKKALETRSYPKDMKTGLKMPSDEVKKHLAAVTAAGRAALADARRAWEKDPPAAVLRAQEQIALGDTALEGLRDCNRRQFAADALATGGSAFSLPVPGGGPRVWITTKAQFDELKDRYTQQLASVGGSVRLREHRRTINKHQSDTLLAMLGEHRTFGGHHTNVVAERDTPNDNGPVDPRGDWQQRLATAEQYFPAEWIAASNTMALKVGTSQRAYYSPSRGLLSMNVDAPTDNDQDGGLAYVDEVNVHELGHRMEQQVPGLTQLEFAYVRQRATGPDGKVEPIETLGYKDPDEVAQRDNWGRAYAGKTYERNRQPGDEPGDVAWEVFQTGLQDTFSRSSFTYGPRDDPEELQAFVIGAMLTLH